MSFDQQAYNKEYNKQKYFRVGVYVPKDKADDLRKCAKDNDMSINQLILTALLHTYDLDLLSR